MKSITRESMVMFPLGCVPRADQKRTALDLIAI